MHEIEVHPATPENQCHCTRLYAYVDKLTEKVPKLSRTTTAVEDKMLNDAEAQLAR